MIQDELSRANLYNFMAKHILDDASKYIFATPEIWWAIESIPKEIIEAYGKNTRDLEGREKEFLFNPEKPEFSKRDALKNDPSKGRERDFNSFLNGIEKKISSVINKRENLKLVKNIAEVARGVYGQKNQIFLSYAHKDKPYTLALFIYFLKFGVYLHVDWMHNPQLAGGVKIKHALDDALKKSSQLLLLLSKNQELILPGNKAIRPWCAWEIGNFYSSNPHEKYYLRLYSDLENKPITNNDNVFIQGIKMIQGIGSGRIY